MNAVITVALYFVCFGIVALCFVLVISGILRWLKAGTTRTRRLNTLSWIAAAVLFITVTVHYTGGIAAPRQSDISSVKTEDVSSSSMDDSGESIPDGTGTGAALEQTVEQGAVNGIFLRVSGAVMKFFLLCMAIAAFAVLVVIAFLCLYRGVRTVILARAGGCSAKIRLAQESEANWLLSEAIRCPMVILIIVGGVLSLFFLLPFLTGDLDSGTSLEIWKDGVCEINYLFGIQPETTARKAFTVNTLASYLMMYIVILGTGFLVIQSSCSLLRYAFGKDRSNRTADEYFRSMAFLLLTVFVLLAFKNGTLPQTGRGELLVELLKSSAMAIAFTVLIAVVLEVLCFLVDTKRNLIPQGMRSLLFYLCGQVIVLALGMVGALFGALNSAIGAVENSDMNRMEMKLRRKLTNTLNAQLDNKKNPQEPAAVKPEKGKNTHQHTFAAFDEKITKK